jgi:predicted alpha/beta hydrolase
MSLDGSHRKCQVTLGTEELGVTRALRFPAGCRRALPILNTALGWGMDKSLIRFLGKDGQPVLTFEPRGADEEGLIARTSAGEAYLLESKDRPAQIQCASASVASSKP